MIRFGTGYSTLLIVFLSMSVSPALAGHTNCPTHYFDGIAPDITDQKMLSSTQEVCFSDFGVMHSGISKTPIWSAEHLTRDALESPTNEIRSTKFHAEDQLPRDSRAVPDDYARSGYDRGHMAPFADMSTEKSRYESFSMANIVPQVPEVNRGVWERIESSVRNLAKKRGELYVITGTLYKGGELRMIGKGVIVPTHTFKIVYDPAEGKAGGYLVENSNLIPDLYGTISVADLEEIAGINFFPKMSESVKQKKMHLPKPSRKGGEKGKRGSVGKQVELSR